MSAKVIGGVAAHTHRTALRVRCGRAEFESDSWLSGSNTHLMMSEASTLSRQLSCRRDQLHMTNSN